jgi:glutathione S-transferase
MKLTLYYAPVTCAMVPFINLVEAGAEFDVVPVNVFKGAQNTPDFVKVNPKRRVPVLAIDGEPLTENVAINLWIARAFPAARLLPSNPVEEIKAISVLAWCACAIHPALTPNALPKRFCDAPGTEESVKECAQRLLGEHFAIADRMLERREWFFDHYTAADAYFFWTFLRATRFEPKHIDLTKFERCQAHLARMKGRPSVERLLAFERQTQESFAKEA